MDDAGSGEITISGRVQKSLAGPSPMSHHGVHKTSDKQAEKEKGQKSKYSSYHEEQSATDKQAERLIIIFFQASGKQKFLLQDSNKQILA